MLAVLLVGIAAYIAIAWRQREHSWKIAGFFLGGRNIGARATKQVYWGTSFSLANGVYYFAVLGYYWGLSAIWFQLPWLLAIAFLAWKLPSLLRETENHTLHGFLGKVYGRGARQLASLVTLTGFLGIFAFEINVSIEILARSLGAIPLIVPFTLLGALFVAAYCDIGGFKGTAATDGPQNLLGTLSVALLMYVVFRVDLPGMSQSNLSPEAIGASLLDFGDIPPIAALGVLCFAFTANIVDMSNWQAISANTAAGSAEIGRLRRAILATLPRVFILPAVTGTFLGYVWRGQSLSDQDLLPSIISQVMPGSDIITGVTLGLVILGLASTALSTADSYLISSVQALSWDLLHYKWLGSARIDAISDDRQRSIVTASRRLLYVLAAGSVAGFLVLRRALGDATVFSAQFVIFGSIVALFPVTLIGLWLTDLGHKLTRKQMRWGLFSIVSGYLAGLVVFTLYLLTKGHGREDMNAYAWAPIATLVCSGFPALVLVGSIRARREPRQ